MGVDIAKAALAAGHGVVATGRNPERINVALGSPEELLAVTLDVANPGDAKDATRAAITCEEFRAQIETTMFGPMNVTRATSLASSAPSSSRPSQRTKKANDLVAQADAYRELSSGLALDDDP
jgi:hypothetical protein